MNYCFRLCKYSKRTVLGIGFLLLFGAIAHAQTSDGPTPLDIKDFAIFSGNTLSENSTGRPLGVEFRSNIKTIGGGAIGTNSNLDMETHVSIDGNVYANSIWGATGNTIKGTTSVLNNFPIDSALKFGGQSLFTTPGKILVNGSAFIKSGAVNGSVQFPPNPVGAPPYAYVGPTPVGGIIRTSPVFPAMPELPGTSEFSTRDTDIISSGTIIPNQYGNVTLDGNKTLVFSGVGDYYFKSIELTNVNNFTFDFKNNTTENIRLFIQGNATLANISVNIINGGNAGHIYTEVQGSGAIEGDNTAFSMNINGTSAHWEGTVFVPYGSITIGQPNSGSANVINGALWSGSKITIGFNTTLTFIPLGSGKASPPSVLPYYPPPVKGKTFSLIGSELTQLNSNPTAFANDSIIYRIFGNKVYIEVISLQGKYAKTLSFLQANGLTDIINNGTGSLIITGKFPIANLLLLNTKPDLIDYVRPLFWPIRNSGIVQTQGDSAMESNFVRGGYALSGAGVKVGVISDSYNTIPGNYAGVDISNGDLPGTGNPNGYLTPINVVGEYTLGQSIDEGRAMLQIVHDVAPGAPLAFRTGFLSAGDFAQGIGQLKNAGCKVIVDDITYITEPYYEDGVVAKAVDLAVSGGVSYFSAAGNFGKKSYEASMFTGTTVPASLTATITTGQVHDFGSGNPYQTLYLEPGNYTIVLQWKDAIYSLGQSSTGTRTDLDLYLVDNSGAALFGFNRDNLNTTTNRIGTDPLEVLPFTVTSATTARLLIAKASGPDVPFKYIVFRGSLTIGGYDGASTIVGQANAAGGIAVGAVLYTNTPPYGLATPTIASFSSIGGMQVNTSLPRNKPELTAPNGVNTTINFNSFDLEPDAFPNFYGTSAAAPHAAAAAALVIEGRQKFLGQSTTPQQIKTLLQTTANHMGVPDPGYSPITGYGFVQPFAAMQTFARPKPEITALVVPSGVTAGAAPFTVTIKGRFLTPDTKVFFNGIEREIVPPSVPDASPSEIQAIIPAFAGDPALQLYNPPISINNNDGGYSDKYYFSFPVKQHVVVLADSKSIKYGEGLPAFTSKVTVDGVNTTPSSVGLTTITYATSATSTPLSNVGSYYIQPKLVTPLATDDPLLKQYTYEFQNGLLTIEKLGLNIIPLPVTLTYGDKIRNIRFNYVLDPTANLVNRAGLINTIQTTHLAAIVETIFALMNGSGATSRALVNGDLENLSILIGNGSGATSRALVNNASGTTETSYVVDVPNESIDNYIYDPETSPTIGNGSGATSRALVNTGPLVNGTASVNVALENGSGATSRALVNGDGGLTNSTPTGTERTNVAVVISPADLDSASIKTKAVNMLTGITAGNQNVVPAAFVSGNYAITYHLGTLTINKASLIVQANTLYSNNGIVPPYTSTINYQYGDAELRQSGPLYIPAPPSSPAPAGKYLIHPSGLVLSADYLNNYNALTTSSYKDAYLYINPYGNSAKKVTLTLKCIETNPSGSAFKYTAHFSYDNKNTVAVYVPIGPDNRLTSAAYFTGTQTTVFETGYHIVDFQFNGQKLTWDVKTNDGTSQKSISEAYVSSSSTKCTGKTPTAVTTSAGKMEQNKILENTGLYPNPATTNVLLYNTDLGAEKMVTVSDIDGRTVKVPAVRKGSQQVELDIRNLQKGVYYVRVLKEGNYKTLSFIKL